MRTVSFARAMPHCAADGMMRRIRRLIVGRVLEYHKMGVGPVCMVYPGVGALAVDWAILATADQLSLTWVGAGWCAVRLFWTAARRH